MIVNICRNSYFDGHVKAAGYFKTCEDELNHDLINRLAETVALAAISAYSA
jgi:hypothetical protein